MAIDLTKHLASLPAPDWGFNGLGEIVYLRTYSRFIEAEGRSETWPETVERVVKGAVAINAKLTDAEQLKLAEHIHQLRGSVSGRALWQLGTNMVERFGQDSLLNCLAGETEVITANGIRPIAELANADHQLMTDYGRWVTAPVRSFGVQELHEVTLRRGKAVKTIRATAGHRWFAFGTSGETKGRRIEKTTADLASGDRLVSVFGQSALNVHPSPIAAAWGITYGDGSLSSDPRRAVSLDLCGTKNHELLKYFPEARATHVGLTSDGEAIFRIDGLPRIFKQRPDLSESKPVLLGWLAGYIAADGHVAETGTVSISSADPSNIRYVRDLAAAVGIPTYSMTTQERDGIDGVRSSIHTIRLDGSSMPNEAFLIGVHRARHAAAAARGRTPRLDWRVEAVRPTGVNEEVFCAVVDDTHSFALADNILTGNCYFTNIATADDIVWLMGRLMVGGGVGFSIESEVIHDFPKVKGAKVTHMATNDADFIVPDSRAGWGELMKRLFTAAFEGKDFTYSTVLIRPMGAPLKTFGGTASGSTALIAGIDDIMGVLNARVGNKLRPVDVLDICNILGRVVVAGSARRSAQIALGDVDDLRFLKAKRWSDGNIPAWRANSNNTLVANEYEDVPSQFWANFDGNSEPYGLFNRKLARTVGRLGEKKSDPSVVGANPCAEIGLAHREACNLATIFLPKVRSREELIEISTLLYKVQKATALLPHPDTETNEIVHKNMRLGQSLTGILQATEEQRSWVSDAYEALVAFDAHWSKTLGVKPSVKLTAVQPSGTLSLLPGVTPGIHGAYARHYIRRVRFGATDPLVEVCRAKGYPVTYDVGIDGREDRSRFVVEFPAMAPADTKLSSEMSAIDQLEEVVWAQQHWADNMVSVTVTYRDEELPAIREWLAANYDTKVKSVSFLRYSDHGFALAPYEPIDEAEYDRRLAAVKGGDTPIALAGVSALDEADCVGGACPVR